MIALLRLLCLFALPGLLAAPTTVLLSSTTHSHSHLPTSFTSTHHTLAPHFNSSLFSFRPTPSHTSSAQPDSNQHDHPHHDARSRREPIIILFAVLGGIFAFAGIIGFLRCLFNYSRTPKQDRVSDFISRHELEREIAQINHNSLFLGHARAPEERPPPPPYLPRPPEYSADDSCPRLPVAMGPEADIVGPPHSRLHPSPPAASALPGTSS